MNCSQSCLSLSRPSSDSMTAIRRPSTVVKAAMPLPPCRMPVARAICSASSGKSLFSRFSRSMSARFEQSFQSLGTVRHDLFDRIRVSEKVVGQMSCKPVAGFRGGECACRLQVAAGRPDFVERDVGNEQIVVRRVESGVRLSVSQLLRARLGCPGRLPWLAIDRVLPAGPCRADRSAAPCTRRAATRPRPIPRLRTERKPRPYRTAGMP